MRKNVFVVFDGFPLGTNRTAEKLRMALGLVLNDHNAVNLLFIGNGRQVLGPLDEAAVKLNPLTKHLTMLSKMKAAFHVEAGSAVPGAEAYAPNTVPADGIKALLDTADAVIH
ncbi:MAG: DsrE family protein [Nitrospinae bacterium]|nr:DsrE family protein [Nitrospinota bacterium]